MEDTTSEILFVASSEETSSLKAAEKLTGHTWLRSSAGSILIFQLENKCQGPRCSGCGFSFCIACGVGLHSGIPACSASAVEPDQHEVSGPADRAEA